MHSRNMRCIRAWCRLSPSWAISTRPSTLSTEYSLIRPLSTISRHAPTRWKRSTSSASPPAVGNSSTGVPYVPQRATATSRSTRPEYQVALTVGIGSPRRRGLLGAPELDAIPEQIGERLDLVGGEERGHLLGDG